MLVDISERKRADAALAEREAQLAAFVEHAPAAIVMFDREMRYLAVSRRFVVDYLPPGTQLIGRSHYEAFPNIPQRWRDIHARVLTGEDLSQDQDQYTRYDGRTDWVRWSMAPWRRANGDVGGALLFAEIITEQVEARRALAESEERLRLAGKAGLVGTFAYDTDTEIMQISEGYVAIHGFPEGTAAIARGTCLAGVHSGDIERVQQRRDEAFCKGSREYSIEYRIIRPGGEVRWVETRCVIAYCNEGCPRRVIGVSIDVTERKRAEERQRVLIAELDHRVKNVLANVSAVVSHTRQESTSMADFVAALDGRIGSMAATHELLSAGRWKGISLRELVRRELAPYATRNNTEINGPEVVLCAESGQAMAMVLHELATNAAKYGALSTSNGRVSIRWDRRSNGYARSQLVLKWREIGGPPIVAPSKPSYGTSTIRDLIPYELGGTVDLVLAADGARCRLVLPACWLGDACEPISRIVTQAATTET
jgi:PAS domain S-box-containing protein